MAITSTLVYGALADMLADAKAHRNRRGEQEPGKAKGRMLATIRDALDDPEYVAALARAIDARTR